MRKRGIAFSLLILVMCVLMLSACGKNTESEVDPSITLQIADLYDENENRFLPGTISWNTTLSDLLSSYEQTELRDENVISENTSYIFEPQNINLANIAWHIVYEFNKEELMRVRWNAELTASNNDERYALAMDLQEKLEAEFGLPVSVEEKKRGINYEEPLWSSEWSYQNGSIVLTLDVSEHSVTDELQITLSIHNSH